MVFPHFSRRYFFERFNYLKKKIPSFSLHHLKSEIVKILFSQKKIIGFSTVVSFCLVLFVGWALMIRSNFIASSKTTDAIVSNDTYTSQTPDVYLPNLSDLDLNILGASDSASNTDVNNRGDKNVDTYPTSAPIPIITYPSFPTNAPLPTLVPYIPPPSPTSVPDCSGIPTAYNSEAIVSSSNSQVNNPVTIEIQLLDCHNNFAPVSDNLTVALVNSDGTARINGLTPPVYIQAQNGKATFTVNSQINITDTFVITDTTRSFTVTDPHNHNPSITFINNSSGNSNCTTATGVPNSWYSDVYPASPQSSTVGTAVTFNVIIRDCDKKTVSGNESLNITLSSGDSSTTVNGNGLPYSLTAVSGQINLSVNSQNAGMATLIIRDTTSSFNITDPNNHNPSVNFTNSTPPTSTPIPTPTQTVTTQAPTLAPTPTSTPQLQPTPTVNPAPTTNITLHPIPS